MAWRVEYYETARGSSPPGDFVEALAAKAQAKVLRLVDLLRERGPTMRPQDAKAIVATKGLYELRTAFGSDAYRLFYFQADENTFVIVHGIRKKTRKTPMRDLETSDQRRADWSRRH